MQKGSVDKKIPSANDVVEVDVEVDVDDIEIKSAHLESDSSSCTKKSNGSYFK